MKKIKATVRDLKEILENETVIMYGEYCIFFRDSISWDFSMNEYIGKSIKISDISYDGNYIYDGFRFKPEWLKDIKEEIDWKNVPVDTKVLVRDFKEVEWINRYFKEYKEGEGYPFSAFDGGRTSWTSNNHTGWKYCKLAEDE